MTKSKGGGTLTARPAMRTHDELQRAHDLIVGIILRESPFPPEAGLTMRDLNLLAQVLCWVLHHDHNPQFSRTLQSIETELRRLGFALTTEPQQ